jgi:TatD DNase family protein
VPSEDIKIPTAGPIIDSHAHVVKEYFADDQDIVIDRAFECGIVQMVNPGVDIKSIPELLELKERYEHIHVGAGLHPHEANLWDANAKDIVRKAASQPKVVAIGECGLDFFYNNSDHESQIRAFTDQIHLAREMSKPLIIHCRDAWAEALDLLEKEGGHEVRGVFHCFTGGPELLERIAALDFYVSFSGIVTFNKAQNIQEAAKLVPDNRILCETDCPYLAPQKVRGKRNEPRFVWFVAEKLAELRHSTLEKVASSCTDNARALFNLPVPKNS